MYSGLSKQGAAQVSAWAILSEKSFEVSNQATLAAPKTAIRPWDITTPTRDFQDFAATKTCA